MVRIHRFAKQINVFTNLLYDSRNLTCRAKSRLSYLRIDAHSKNPGTGGLAVIFPKSLGGGEACQGFLCKITKGPGGTIDLSYFDNSKVSYFDYKKVSFFEKKNI